MAKHLIDTENSHFETAREGLLWTNVCMYKTILFVKSYNSIQKQSWMNRANNFAIAHRLNLTQNSSVYGTDNFQICFQER